MKLSDKLQDAMNEQVAMEYHAAYLYNGMRAYLEELGAMGAYHWMDLQAKEELTHAQDFIDAIHDLDGHVELAEIPAVESEYDSLTDVWETGLAHEKEISASIRAILEIAIEEKNYEAENFLRTYVDEQVEEEDNFRSVLDLLNLAGDDKASLFRADEILGQRQAGQAEEK